jgi:hypothetical protein
VGRQETPNSEIWESALASLLLMVTAKSEDLEFSPPHLGNFSKGDAQSRPLSFVFRPTTDTWRISILVVTRIPVAHRSSTTDNSSGPSRRAFSGTV